MQDIRSAERFGLAGGAARLESGPDTTGGPGRGNEETGSLGWGVEGVGLGSSGRGERQEFTIVETVRRKVGGSVFLVEGRGTKKADKKEEVVVHEALTVVSYDGKAKRYRWQSHDLRGQALEVEPKLVDGGIEWGFRSEEGGVTVRFTIQFDAQRWHEVGEASTDAKTWNKFLEMTLERQK